VSQRPANPRNSQSFGPVSGLVIGKPLKATVRLDAALFGQ
jgi:hypothetical protein